MSKTIKNNLNLKKKYIYFAQFKLKIKRKYIKLLNKQRNATTEHLLRTLLSHKHFHHHHFALNH